MLITIRWVKIETKKFENSLLLSQEEKKDEQVVGLSEEWKIGHWWPGTGVIHLHVEFSLKNMFSSSDHVSQVDLLIIHGVGMKNKLVSDLWRWWWGDLCVCVWVCTLVNSSIERGEKK